MINRALAWGIFAVCVLYLITPLAAQFDYSLRMRRGTLSADAYTSVLAPSREALAKERPGEILGVQAPRFYASLAFSLLAAVLTIVMSTALVVPTAYWVNLRAPALKPIVEFVTVLPFAIPGIVLVFGLLRTYSSPPFALTSSEGGTLFLLIGGYTTFVLPYLYRAVDAGLRAIDLRTLTDAARSLGASWVDVIWRIVLPNMRTAVISGSLLTFVIALGEYVLVNYLFPDERAFGSYLAGIGRNRIFEPAALTILSFALTWVFVALIQRVARGAEQTLGGPR
jgi:putative spermidine/putrescine transport system permease protein